MEYKLLPLEFDKNQFHFKELLRDGEYRIYEKTKGKYRGFEVVRTRFHNGYTIGGVFIKPAQMLPSNEEWGKHGFSPLTYEKCLKRLEWMKNIQFKEEPALPPIVQKRNYQPGEKKRGRKPILKACQACGEMIYTSVFQRGGGKCLKCIDKSK